MLVAPAYYSRLGLLGALFATTACGQPEAPPLVDDTQSAEVEDPWAAPLHRVRDAARRHSRRASALSGSREGIAEARRAAALARVLSIRDPDGGWIASSRVWLTEAADDPAIPGACMATLELAELEARDAVDLHRAYELAAAVENRFPSDVECGARAARVVRALSPWQRPGGSARPPEAYDGDAVARPTRTADNAAAWAAERAQVGARVRMQELSVYAQGHEGDEATSVRSVLTFDGVAAFEHGEAPAGGSRPRRTWLELPGVQVADSIARRVAADAGGLRSVVIESRADGARVTFELDDDARFRAFVLPDPYRIVMDVERGGPRASDAVRRIVLDPGHGGNDFGARAFGMREADLTLDITLRARAILARRLPEVRVFLTRRDDTFVSLEHRCAMANALDADLFLSVHLNAADEEVERGGVTTFVLDTTNDQQARRLAARENGTTTAAVDGLSYLLASLHREEQARGSRALAAQVHRGTLTAARGILPGLHDRGLKSAMFYVLVGARMPAVLLEASFLSREEEADALRTAAYRQAIAEGLADGLVRYAGR